jgi:flagellar basal-body rod modification protein FlgD
MSIQGINGTDTTTSSSATTGLPQSQLDKSAFLTLLVSQLKSQDPLAPTDNKAFIAQLAQFSSLEEAQKLNDNILGLAVLQQTNALMAQLTQSSALIGKQVKYIDPETELEQQGEVSSVKISEGLAMLAIGGKDVPLGNLIEITGSTATGSETTAGETADTTNG